MVYYGDEVGMTGFNDPDCRACMDWDQTTWNMDMMSWIATLAALRKNNIALRRGTEATIQASENTIVRSRTHAGQQILVLANRGSAPATISVDGFTSRTGTELITGQPVACSQIVVPPRGVRLVSLGS